MRQSIIGICALLIAASPALGQQTQELGVSGTYPAPAGPRGIPAPPVRRLSILGQDRPRWRNAAVIGAVAGGASFAVMHAMFSGWNSKPNSMVRDVAIGVVGGAAVAGGSVAFFDWVCAPGSASDNAGLCSQLPAGRFPDGTRGGGMRPR